jgi:hypothetical protein
MVKACHVITRNPTARPQGMQCGDGFVFVVLIVLAEVPLKDPHESAVFLSHQGNAVIGHCLAADRIRADIQGQGGNGDDRRQETA